MNVLSWLRPTELVENIGRGYFQLNDRRPTRLSETSVVWNDVKYPKTIAEAYSDKYRILKISCLFDWVDNNEQELLVAIQLTFENIEDPDVVVVAPVCGVKGRDTPWSYELELQPSEYLVGIKHFARAHDLWIRTSHGTTVSMKTGDAVLSHDTWTLPPGFRIYGFHGVFDDGYVSFLGPVFKAMELKQWSQELYKELPRSFKIRFQLLVLIKNRHRNTAPDPNAMNLWQLPEVAWDKVVNMLLHECYFDMDLNTFFGGLCHFQT